jgi:hypothetical protein
MRAGSWVSNPAARPFTSLLTQQLRSSAVLAIGAATLADIYDSHERGSKMGLYYSAPLLGPSIGPILGGGSVIIYIPFLQSSSMYIRLTQAFNWRACFWLLVIFGGLNLCSFAFLFKDTFRRERSLAYQRVLQRNKKLQPQRAKASIPRAVEAEKTEVIHSSDYTPRPSSPSLITTKLSLRDIDPITPMLRVLRSLNNPVILSASGMFAVL